jgi:hypothetical protein
MLSHLFLINFRLYAETLRNLLYDFFILPSIEKRNHSLIWHNYLRKS